MFEFLRKTPTVVGLDISSTAVKLLELSQDKGQYRVESYGVEVIPENAIVEKNIADIDAVGGAIKRVRQKSKTKVKEVGVAVAGSSVITKTLELAASLSVVGRLFRNSARTNDKDELLIFITPRIIREGVGVR